MSVLVLLSSLENLQSQTDDFHKSSECCDDTRGTDDFSWPIVNVHQVVRCGHVSRVDDVLLDDLPLAAS